MYGSKLDKSQKLPKRINNHKLPKQLKTNNTKYQQRA